MIAIMFDNGTHSDQVATCYAPRCPVYAILKDNIFNKLLFIY